MRNPHHHHPPAKLPIFSVHSPPPLPSLEPAVRTQALTHQSAGAPGEGALPGGFENAGVFVDNERLEFVGDGFLYALAAELVYREFPRLTPAYLSKIRSALVTNELLAHWATLYSLDADLILHPSHAHLRTSTKVRGDTFEAYVAAVRMYRGSEICTSWLFALMRPYAQELYDFYKRQAEATASPHAHAHGRKRSLSCAPAVSPQAGSPPTPAALYDVADPFWVGSAPALSASPPSPPAIVTDFPTSSSSEEEEEGGPPSAGTEPESQLQLQLAKPAKVRILGVPIPFMRRRTLSTPAMQQALPAASPALAPSPSPQQLIRRKDSSSKLLRFRWSRSGGVGPAEAALRPISTGSPSSESRVSSDNGGGSSSGRFRLESSSPSVETTDTSPSSVAGGSTDALGSPLGTPTKTKPGPYPLLTGPSPLKRVAHSASPPSPMPAEAPVPAASSSPAHAQPQPQQKPPSQAELLLAELGMQVPRPLPPSAPTRPLFLANPVSFLHETYNRGGPRHGHGHGAHRRVHYVERLVNAPSGPGRTQWEVLVHLDGHKVGEGRADVRKDAKTFAAEAAIRGLHLDEGSPPLLQQGQASAQADPQAQQQRGAPASPNFASGDVSPLLLATPQTPTVEVVLPHSCTHSSNSNPASSSSSTPAQHTHISASAPPSSDAVPYGRDELGIFFLASQSGSQQKPVFHLWIMRGTACLGYGKAGRKTLAETAARADWAENRRNGRVDTESIPPVSFRGVRPLPAHPSGGRFHAADPYQMLCALFFLGEPLPRLVFVEIPPHPESPGAGRRQRWCVTVLVDGARRGAAEDAWRSRARSRASTQVLEWLKEIQAK